MNTIKIPVRILGFDSRVSAKNGKTYADLTARFGTKIVKFPVDSSKGIDFATRLDEEVTLECEITPAFQTQVASLRVVGVEE